MAFCIIFFDLSLWKWGGTIGGGEYWGKFPLKFEKTPEISPTNTIYNGGGKILKIKKALLKYKRILGCGCLEFGPL